MAEQKLKYEVNILNTEDLEKLGKLFSEIEESLESEELLKFIAEKAMAELQTIIDTELDTEDYETDYRSSNKYEILEDQIRIYNDSRVDLSELSEETRQYYADGLSLAKIIEFGTGIPRNRQRGV